MDLSSQNYERLIHLIYETIHDAKGWEQTLLELREALDCKVVHAFAIDKHHDTISFSTGSNLPVDGELSYLQKYQFIDPRSKHWRALPALECFHDHEVFDDSYVAHSAFYQEFLLPYGVRYLSALKVIESDDMSFSIACLRGPEQGPLPAEAIQFIHRLLPHLHRAVKINTSQFIYATQALIGHTLINKLKQPVILTTINGKVVLTNHAAQQLLANTGLVSINKQSLCMPEPCLSQFLGECAGIEQHIKNGQYADGDSHTYKILTLQSQGPCGHREKLLALYLPLVPQCTPGIMGLRPLIMLMFYHPESTAPVDTTLFCAAFGLSPAESKIAAMLAEGYAVIEIAASLGKKEDTIRKQLQSIYQKTSTNRQPELIKLLMHLPGHVQRI